MGLHGWISLLLFVGVLCWTSTRAQLSPGVQNNHLKSQREYENLRAIDREIEYLLEAQPSTPLSLETCIALAQLYQVREEQFMQSGHLQSLEYTRKALVIADQMSDSSFDLMFALHTHEALLLHGLGRVDETIEVANSVLAQLPDDSSFKRMRSLMYLVRGDAFLSNGSLALAARDYQQAIVIDSCQHKAYLKLAVALAAQQAKRQDDDLAVQSTILALEQDVRYLLNRVTLDSHQEVILRVNHSRSQCVFTDGEENFDILQEHSQLRERADFLVVVDAHSPQKRLRSIQSTLQWTLFTLLHSQGAHRRADGWHALQQARYLDRYEFASTFSWYSVADSVAAAQHLRSFFKPEYWPRQEPFLGSLSKTPVFIVGFFRSGSTLLESLLHRHPRVWGQGEQSEFTSHMHILESEMNSIVISLEANTTADTDQESSKKNANTRKQIRQDMQQWKKLQEAIRSRGSMIVRNMRQRFVDINAQWKQRHTNRTDNKHSWGSLDWSTMVKNESQVTRIVDKMLINYRNIALIHLVFPRAVILHSVRDPLDTLFSCLSHRFVDAPYTLEVRTLVIEYVAYLEIMRHFRSVLPLLTPSGAASGTLSQRRQALVDVRYEALVANPHQTLQQVLQILDIESDDDTVRRILSDFHEQQRNVRTASFLQVQRPVYQSSVGRWREYAPYVEETLGRLLRPQLERLSKAKGLPFDDDDEASSINWKLSADFDYEEMMNALQFS